MSEIIQKQYVSPNEYQRCHWILAKKIFDSGWKPDLMLALWRGGSAVGISVHEYCNFRGWTFMHQCVKCSSYTGIKENDGGVLFDEISEKAFNLIKPGMKVLVVDDIFDTGKTCETVKNRITAMGAEMRMACVYRKVGANQTDCEVDYYVKDVDCWLVFPHELMGLTKEELEAKDEFFTS
ncbi:MAG: hypothetical protein J6V88_05330 [Kiritimatiellae bacterium]|nr:hypothetical protein [Kiritimatiellia bacterium]